MDRGILSSDVSILVKAYQRKGDFLQVRTDAERIELLHQRARNLKDQNILKFCRTASVCLFAALLAVIVQIDIPLQSLTVGGLAGSSLLGESAGAYVLVAVISFTAAVCITVYCLRKRKD